MSNEMGSTYIEDGMAEEWVMTLPNFLIFSVLGFLSGIRNKDNEKELDSITEDLYRFHIESINTLTDIGNRFVEQPKRNFLKRRTRTKNK
jgi:hypothetical protein